MQVLNFENVEKLNIFAAEKFVEIAKDSIEKRGRLTVALSGGSTPKKLYALLVESPFREQIEWQHIHFFFGDERYVPKDSEKSNYRMANENLFIPLEIPVENIHRFQTERGDPETVAFIMDDEIQDFFQLKEPRFPRFDLIFLGMGADGHTASLFPQTSALQEFNRITTQNYLLEIDLCRLTFTFPTINNARNIIFLIAGADKKETLRQVLEGEFQPDKLPSQMVKPTNGNLLFLTSVG